MPTNWRIMPICPNCKEQHWLSFLSGLCDWCEWRLSMKYRQYLKDLYPLERLDLEPYSGSVG